MHRKTKQPGYLKRKWRWVSEDIWPWIKKTYGSGILHAIIGMITIILLFITLIILTGTYQPEPPRINDKAQALEKILEKTN